MPETSKPKVVVALMGPTGTGKSTFINLLTKNNEIRIGHDLESQTIDINEASYTMDGRHITLVDTPGFDDSRQGVTDTDILGKIANFLQENGGKEINGIIYLHRISDPRMGGITKKNLRMFRELCGDNNLKNVRIVTTYWSIVDKQEGNSRQTALANGAFKPLIDGGAKLIAHDLELESARQIMTELIGQIPVKLKIQEELDAGKVLADTSAGAVIMEEMKEVQQKHDKEMEALQKEMEEAAMENNDDLEAELAEERQKLQSMLAQMDEDRRRMERTRIVRETRPQRMTEDRSTKVAGSSTSNALRDTKLEELAHRYQGSEYAGSFTVESEVVQQTPVELNIQAELEPADTSAVTVIMEEMQRKHTKEKEDWRREKEAVEAKYKNLLAEERRKRMELVQVEDWKRNIDRETWPRHDRKRPVDNSEELVLGAGKSRFAADKGKGKAVTTQVLPNTGSNLHARAKRERSDDHYGYHGSRSSPDRATVILSVVAICLAAQVIVILLLID